MASDYEVLARRQVMYASVKKRCTFLATPAVSLR